MASLPTRLFLLLLLISSAQAKEISVGNVVEFAAAASALMPGDTLILRDGIWADVSLKVRATGTAEKPVTIKAQSPGQVVLTGTSRIALAGAHLVVDGLWFKNPTGEESITLRIDSDELANDCRITQCAVTNDLPATPEQASRFVSIYGSRNRIDHCYFSGKTTVGATMIVWLPNHAQQPVQHRIDHNHFGPRPRLGQNGGETIRIGDSKTSMQTAACVVEHNLFEKCNGESECISNKSCGNLYRHNFFKGVSGALTLRHGNACRVEGNYFQGNKEKGTGGVRVIGEDHIVTGNIFDGLTGTHERSALSLMLGIPHSAPYGYFQVKRAQISGNTFFNCAHNILIGLSGDKKASLPPVETEISSNRIQTNQAEAFEIKCAVDGVSMKDNETSKEMPPPRKFTPERAGPAWWK